MIPIERKIQDTITHGFVFVAQFLSKLSLKSPANAKDQTIDRPTYPRYKKGDEMLIQDLVKEGLNQYPHLELEIIFQMGLI